MEFEEPDFGFADEPDCEYCTPASFDKFGFLNSFDRYLKHEFPGCIIRSNHRLGEFEIQGPNYDTFYDEHADKLEEIATEHDGWYHYEPEVETVK